MSRSIFQLFVIFVYNRIFLSPRGNFTQLLGPDPKNYSFVARKTQKGMCTNGPAWKICSHESSPTGRRVEKKNDNNDNDNKSKTNDKKLARYQELHPLVGPSQMGQRDETWGISYGPQGNQPCKTPSRSDTAPDSRGGHTWPITIHCLFVPNLSIEEIQ